MTGGPRPNGGRLTPADRSAIEQTFVALLDRVPDAVDDDGFGIFAGLVNAENWEDLNQQSKLPDARAMVGRRLKVFTVTKRPSDLAEGFSHYLIVEAADLTSGESVMFQTSSAGVAVPLIKLHVWGKLPAQVLISEPDKLTKAGHKPLNLTVLAVNG